MCESPPSAIKLQLESSPKNKQIGRIDDRHRIFKFLSQSSSGIWRAGNSAVIAKKFRCYFSRGVLLKGTHDRNSRANLSAYQGAPGYRPAKQKNPLLFGFLGTNCVSDRLTQNPGNWRRATGDWRH